MNRIYSVLRINILVLLAGVLSFAPLGSVAQGLNTIDAVAVITTTPASVYLTDYTAMGSNAFMLNVTFKDFSVPSYKVRMKFEISKPNLSITTTETYWSTHEITVYPGMNAFTGADLSGYFNVANMNISGDGADIIRNTKSLPEGDYNFCVKIYDYRLDKELASVACAWGNLRKQFPPMLSLPIDQTVFNFYGDPIINFQWQNQGYFVPVVYDFKLVEVPDGITPLNAMSATLQPVMFSSDIGMTSLYYGPSDPPLVNGKTYAWRVQVRDVTGMTRYENNGYSPIWTFKFMQQKTGTITLQGPDNDVEFKPDDPITLSWVPSEFNFGQEVEYRYKILGLYVPYVRGNSFEQGNMDHSLRGDEINNNKLWVDVHTEKMDASIPQSFDITVPIPTQSPAFNDFLWGVTAYARDDNNNLQKVGQSPARHFSVKPVRDHFYAAGRLVTVVTTTNGSQKRFSGTGMVQVDKNSSETYLATFENLDLRIVNHEYYVETGEVIGDFNSKISLKNGDNGNAYFNTESFVLNKSEAEVLGEVTWEYPLANTGSDVAIFNTRKKRYDFTSSHISATLTPTDAKEFVLLDPVKFKVNYAKTSELTVKNDTLSLKLDGKVTYLGTEDSPPFTLTFEDADNPYYFVNNVSGDDLASVTWATNEFVKIVPGETVIDFSGANSFGGLGNSWKGVYFKKYQISNYGSNTFIQNAVKSDAWISSSGLNLTIADLYSPARPTTYNGFTGTQDSLNLTFVEGSMSGRVTGGLRIPVLAKSLKFTVPIDNEGLNTLFIDYANVKDLVLTLNPTIEEDKVDITIKQATLKSDYLDMTVNVAWSQNQIAVNNLHEFRIWKNGNVGFTTINGSVALTTKVDGVAFGGFEISVDSITACRHNKKVAIGFSASIVVSDDMTGPGGDVPRTHCGVDWAPPDEVPPPRVPTPGNVFAEGTWGTGTNTSQKVVIRMIVPKVVEAEGTLTITKNDPVYGNSFQGTLQAKLEQPAEKSMSASFMVGKKTDVKDGVSKKYNYWFFQASIGDISVPVGFVTFTGFTGRVYHHMKGPDPCNNPDEDAGYEPSADISYGGGFKAEFKDTKSQGKDVQGAGELNMSFNASGGLADISVIADAKFGNKTTRSTTVYIKDDKSSTVIGHGCFHYSKDDNVFHAYIAATVNATVGVCGSGYIEVMSSDSKGLSFNVGDPKNKIQLTFCGKGAKSCSGTTLSAYVTYNEKVPKFDVKIKHVYILGKRVDYPVFTQNGYETVNKYNFGLFYGAVLEGSTPTIDFLVCSGSLTGRAEWSIGADGEIVNGQLTEVGVLITAEAYIAVKYSCGILGSGTKKLIDIVLTGEMRYKVVEKKIKGDVSVRFSVLGLARVSRTVGISQSI